jgi:hypothetical protein
VRPAHPALTPSRARTEAEIPQPARRDPQDRRRAGEELQPQAGGRPARSAGSPPGGQAPSIPDPQKQQLIFKIVAICYGAETPDAV